MTPEEQIENLRSQMTILVEALKDKVSDFNGTIIGLAHDVDNFEERLKDFKKDQEITRSDISEINRKLAKHEVSAKGASVKTDVIWKILIAIATAASIAALAGG